jgi:hypothetical protein
VRLNRGNAPALVGTGFAVGALSGFFGIGGGFLIVPGLILATGMPMLQAVGTSLVAVTAFGLTTAASYAIGGAGGLGLAASSWRAAWRQPGRHARGAGAGAAAGAAARSSTRSWASPIRTTATSRRSACWRAASRSWSPTRMRRSTPSRRSSPTQGEPRQGQVRLDRARRPALGGDGDDLDAGEAPVT